MATGLKILGMNPKDFYAGWPVQSDFGRELYRSPALTFPLLRRLIPDRHEMRFFEGFFEPLPMRKYIELIKWPDVVGFNIASSYGSISYAVAIAQIRRLNPRAFIIAGGHHANVYAERWLELGVDLVVKGEAERSFPILIEELEGGRHFERVPGVVFRQDGQVVETAPAPQLENLDDSPIPDLSLINFKLYPCLIDPRRGHIGAMETSRGCAFRCKFCAVPGYWKGAQRYKSVGRVMEEIKNLEAHRCHQINIVDDGFGNDPAFLDELLEAMRRHPNRLNWNAFLRVDTVMKNTGLIDRLAAAGMRATLLGFESVNEEVLRRQMGKGMRVPPSLGDYQEMYQRFRRHEIMVVGVFISGHPEIQPEQETPYRVARTICDDPRLADYMPFPGALGYQELADKYPVKDMFFHDVKLPVFPWHSVEAFRFNLLNVIDVPRSLRMLFGPPWHRYYLLVSHLMLWTKFLRVNRRKLRDFMLLRNDRMSADNRQQKLMEHYLEDPAYAQWLDRQTRRKWF